MIIHIDYGFFIIIDILDSNQYLFKDEKSCCVVGFQPEMRHKIESQDILLTYVFAC